MTFSQHTWPKRSIERFADATGKVNLFDRKRDKVRMAAPGDAIFCVKRVWGHGAEVGFMKNIDNFQSLVDDVVAGNVTFFDQKQKENAGAFFLLWRSRADHRTAEGADPVKLNNVTGHSWLKDQQERFEKHGIWFIREDGTMPDRSLRGFRIQWEIDGGVDELASGQWGIFCAEAGEFLVPDHPGPACSCPVKRAIGCLSRSLRRFVFVGVLPELQVSVGGMSL